MIVELKYVNPIDNQLLDVLTLEYPVIDYFYFKHIYDYNNDEDLQNILKVLLKDLDCTIEYECGRLMMTNFPIYKIHLSDYYFYLTRITNQFIYNIYIDKLIKRHIANLIFEYNNPYINKKNTKKKKTPPNKYIKQTTKNMFTNEEDYIYYNLKTKKNISSDNPNLLEELNSPKKKGRKKSIKIKEVGVPISAMTFSFKKK